MPLPPATAVLLSELRAALTDKSPVMLLTGAGISAESGIPTFRGKDGYWRVGSRNYHAQELATQAAFRRMPDEVWSWYLYRRAVCLAAAPNPAHVACAELEHTLRERMLLVTQNVDGLHLRAGSTPARTFQIHGNLNYMRCADACGGPAVLPIPDVFGSEFAQGRALSEPERTALRCPDCGGRTRPHVLWFDESYDEPLYRFESSLQAARRTPLLIVVGTTGSTNLPLHIGSIVAQRGATMIVVNPEPNPFTEQAARYDRGLYLEGNAGEWLPELLAAVAAAAA